MRTCYVGAWLSKDVILKLQITTNSIQQVSMQSDLVFRFLLRTLLITFNIFWSLMTAVMTWISTDCFPELLLPIPCQDTPLFSVRETILWSEGIANRLLNNFICLSPWSGLFFGEWIQKQLDLAAIRSKTQPSLSRLLQDSGCLTTGRYFSLLFN